MCPVRWPLQWRGGALFELKKPFQDHQRKDGFRDVTLSDELGKNMMREVRGQTMPHVQNYRYFRLSPPSKILRLLVRAKRGEFFFASLTISCAGGRQTHGVLDFGRRVEQRWAYYFSRRRTREAARHTGCWTSAGA